MPVITDTHREMLLFVRDKFVRPNLDGEFSTAVKSRTRLVMMRLANCQSASDVKRWLVSALSGRTVESLVSYRILKAEGAITLEDIWAEFREKFFEK